MPTPRLVLLLALLSLVFAGCGDDEPARPAGKAPETARPAPDAEPEEESEADEEKEGEAAGPAGTYALDVKDWLARAKKDAVRMRHTDLSNLARRADSYFTREGEDREAEPPEAPPALADMTDEQRSAFEKSVLAYLDAEAAALEETLTLNADGTFLWEHSSRCEEGGSSHFGIVGVLSAKGTWTKEGDKLTLQHQESTSPGRTWKNSTKETGTFQDDGSIRMNANWRNGIRGIDWVVRKE